VFKHVLKALKKVTFMMWFDVKLDHLKQNLCGTISKDYKIMCSDLHF
jgi:hypothetical protein